jgi:hypothetical protein
MPNLRMGFSSESTSGWKEQRPELTLRPANTETHAIDFAELLSYWSPHSFTFQETIHAAVVGRRCACSRACANRLC